jgi:membrane protein DedA with SNARE-associated domain
LNGLTRLVLRYGLTFLFLNVFLEQIGVPIPAVPTLVVAGALVADGKLPGAAALAAALVIVGVALALYVAFGGRSGRLAQGAARPPPRSIPAPGGPFTLEAALKA